jgi:hypothetical protein
MPVVPAAQSAFFPDAPALVPAVAPSSVAGAGPSEQQDQGLRSLRGYAVVAGLVSLHSWYGDSDKENLSLGGYVAGYWAPNSLFHLGAFFHAHTFTGEANDSGSRSGGHLGAGVSLKFGGSPVERLWFGGALDLGVHIAIGTGTSAGAEVFPRLEIDGQILQSGSLKLALFGSFGPVFAPALTDYMRSDSDGPYVSLQMLLGVMVGG